jgi:hypothetical protein
MIRLAKMWNDKIVQIVRISPVQFAPGTWILICTDWENPYNKQTQLTWVPVTTNFQWTKEFLDSDNLTKPTV